MALPLRKEKDSLEFLATPQAQLLKSFSIVYILVNYFKQVTSNGGDYAEHDLQNPRYSVV